MPSPAPHVERGDSPARFRWRKLLETSVYGSLEDRHGGKINASYVGRLMRMTLPALDIAETILDGRQPTEMTLVVLMGPLPINWDEQRARTGRRNDQSRL
ncbi:MAG: hypothetical protein ACXU9B_06005 [Reyranella sp.]